VARKTLTTGLARWQKIAGAGGFQSTPVPTNRLALYGGEKLRKGGLKLEVAYRDLPRGEVLRSGNAQFPNSYNLGWFDLTQKEVKSIATNSRKKTVISDGVFQKLARTRHQGCGAWSDAGLEGRRNVRTTVVAEMMIVLRTFTVSLKSVGIELIEVDGGRFSGD